VRSIVLRLLIITLLCYVGVRFWYERIERGLQERGPAGKAVVVAPAPEDRDQPEETATGYAIIVERNIFQADGTAAASPGTIGGAGDGELEEQLAETSLQLALLGTVSGNQEDARAIIRDEKTRQENLYAVGGVVQGAEIVRINQGKVVLRIQDREEILVIREPDATASRGRPAPRDTAAQWSPEPEPQPEKVPEAVPGRRFTLHNPPPQKPPKEPEDMEALPQDLPEELEDATEGLPQDLPEELEDVEALPPGQ
jgi:hypothetical protein